MQPRKGQCRSGLRAIISAQGAIGHRRASSAFQLHHRLGGLGLVRVPIHTSKPISESRKDGRNSQPRHPPLMTRPQLPAGSGFHTNHLSQGP